MMRQSSVDFTALSTNQSRVQANKPAIAQAQSRPDGFEASQNSSFISKIEFNSASQNQNRKRKKPVGQRKQGYTTENENSNQ